jgi:hypothetical protein
MKRRIRLTESDLHRIIEQAINEIGDTPEGQQKLGALAGRRYARETYDAPTNGYYRQTIDRARSGAKDLDNYAGKQFSGGTEYFDYGFESERLRNATLELRGDLKMAIDYIDRMLNSEDAFETVNSYDTSAEIQENIRELLQRIAGYANDFFLQSSADRGIQVH